MSSSDIQFTCERAKCISAGRGGTGGLRWKGGLRRGHCVRGHDTVHRAGAHARRTPPMQRTSKTLLFTRRVHILYRFCGQSPATASPPPPPLPPPAYIMFNCSGRGPGSFIDSCQTHVSRKESRVPADMSDGRNGLRALARISTAIQTRTHELCVCGYLFVHM